MMKYFSSSIEQKARSQGWAPEEEWKGNPRDWKTAKQFVSDGEFMHKISTQSQELKELKATIAEMNNFFKQSESRRIEDQYNDITNKRREAIELGDVHQVEMYDQEAKKLQQQAQQVQYKPAQAVDPIAQEFLQRNSSWFNDSSTENTAMSNAATAYEQFLRDAAAAKGQTVDTREVLTQVEEQIKSQFPHRFGNQNRQRPAAVSHPLETAPSSSSKKKVGFNDLTASQKERYSFVKRSMESRGVDYTLDQYVDALRKHGAIRD